MDIIETINQLKKYKKWIIEGNYRLCELDESDTECIDAAIEALEKQKPRGIGCNDCAICRVEGTCLAGRTDNDYAPATKEQIINRLDNEEYPYSRSKMIEYLRKKFNYEYKGHDKNKYN